MTTAAADALIQASLIGEAVDRGPALIFVADEDMRYTAVNARACSELGYARSELVGMSVTDVCRYDTAGDEFADLLRSGERAGTAIATRKDGSEFTLAYTAAESRIAGMLFYVSIGRVVA